jgi:hypothetical protein
MKKRAIRDGTVTESPYSGIEGDGDARQHATAALPVEPIRQSIVSRTSLSLFSFSIAA